MKEYRMQLLCTTLISIAIVIGCVWIGFSIRDQKQEERLSKASDTISDKALLTEEEAADYLSMSKEQLYYLLAYEEEQRQKMNVYDTYSFIPFVKIDNVKYFNKEQLDEWVRYNVLNHREIDTKAN